MSVLNHKPSGVLVKYRRPIWKRDHIRPRIRHHLVCEVALSCKCRVHEGIQHTILSNFRSLTTISTHDCLPFFFQPMLHKKLVLSLATWLLYFILAMHFFNQDILQYLLACQDVIFSSRMSECILWVTCNNFILMWTSLGYIKGTI
jgi:hypothetical protein